MNAPPITLVASPGPLRTLLITLLDQEGMAWQAPGTPKASGSGVLEVCREMAPGHVPDAPWFVIGPGTGSLARFLEAGARDGMAADRVRAAPDECRIRLRLCFAQRPSTPTPRPAVRIRHGCWELDLEEGLLGHEDGFRCRLTRTEARLAATLMAGRGRLVPQDTLALRVWEDRDCQVNALIKRYIARLRHRLGIHAGTIRNEPGRGYAWL